MSAVSIGLATKALTAGEVLFRKAYLGSLIDRVKVNYGEVRIVGRSFDPRR